jgi:hypothetical protein
VGEGSGAWERQIKRHLLLFAGVAFAVSHFAVRQPEPMMEPILPRETLGAVLHQTPELGVVRYRLLSDLEPDGELLAASLTGQRDQGTRSLPPA